MTMWDQLSAEEMAWKRDCARFATEQLLPRHGVHDRENTFPQQDLADPREDLAAGGEPAGQYTSTAAAHWSYQSTTDRALTSAAPKVACTGQGVRL